MQRLPVTIRQLEISLIETVFGTPPKMRPARSLRGSPPLSIWGRAGADVECSDHEARTIHKV